MKVFISYAHKDREVSDRLQRILDLKERATLWRDDQILPGADWDNTIRTELLAADIILLLFSRSFIESSYILSNELGPALVRHESAEARVIPILLTPCDWLLTPVAKLQALPAGA